MHYAIDKRKFGMFAKFMYWFALFLIAKLVQSHHNIIGGPKVFFVSLGIMQVVHSEGGIHF